MNTLQQIKEWYEDHFWCDAAEALASPEGPLSRLSPTQQRLWLDRLRATEKMKPWQLFIATEQAMAIRNNWPF